MARQCQKWGVRILLVVCLGVSWARAQEVSREARLLHRAEGLCLEIDVPLEGKEVVFKAEPDFGKRKIVRGVLSLGEKDKDVMGFAWDENQSRLYLDVNRNLDLTDDETGTFEAQDQFAGFQTFKDIQVRVAQDEITLPYTIEMQFFSTSFFSSCDVTIQSGWQGEIELRGARWQLAIVDDLNGEIGCRDALVLKRMDKTSSPSATEEMNRVTPCGLLYLDGQAYEVTYRFELTHVEPDLVLTFKEVHPAVGELIIEGQYISRLILESDSCAALFDAPKGTMSIPAGIYESARLYLDAGETFGLFSGLVSSVSVPEGSSLIFKAGAPLNNTVEVNRSGASLQMMYEITGIGGEIYERISDHEVDTPGVVIRKGDTQIAEGHFEYG